MTTMQEIRTNGFFYVLCIKTMALFQSFKSKQLVCSAALSILIVQLRSKVFTLPQKVLK